jgi:hypothetical protein
MERSAIRDEREACTPLPDFASLHPGYEELRKRNAVRRCSDNLRSLAGCSAAPTFILPACGGGHRRGQHAFRRSTAVLARGTHASQRLSSGQASRGKRRKVAGVSRPAPAPVAASTSRAGHSVGRLIPEPPESSSDEPPPAGTALAPPAAVTRLASFVSEIDP